MHEELTERRSELRPTESTEGRNDFRTVDHGESEADFFGWIDGRGGANCVLRIGGSCEAASVRWTETEGTRRIVCGGLTESAARISHFVSDRA